MKSLWNELANSHFDALRKMLFNKLLEEIIDVFYPRIYVDKAL